MATTREKIDSRGKSLLQLLTVKQSEMANLINPSPTDGGTYDAGGGKEVDILWPTADSTIGSDVGINQQYFLREFNLENVPSSQLGDVGGGGRGDGVLSEAQHTQGGFARGVAPVWRKTEGKQHNQPFVNNNTGYADPNSDRSEFMKRSKRKSLATLYWEMRGAFVNNQNKGYFAAQGQDGQDKTYTNRHGGATDADTYDGQFVNQTSELYWPPTNTNSLVISSSNGFNLGQILGGSTTVIEQLIDRGKQITRDWFQNLLNDAGENQFLRSYIETMQGAIMGGYQGAERVSQLYRPGWDRPMQPEIHRAPLIELLQQNLLLPPDGGLLPMGSTNGTEPRVSTTFRELYTNNRAKAPQRPANMIDRNRYNKGTLAGTGINDLQEPLKEMDGSVAAPGGKADVPFTFEGDDNVYLTHTHKHQGFVSNTRNTQINPDQLESAVADFDRAEVDTSGTYRGTGAKVVLAGEAQYFPFTFSTVNKKDGRVQICSLQASIQSLGESYTPTWQSKHFFGRSEQIHTYTFTDRTIDLSFVVHANEMRLLQNVYERVLWLAQQTYPDYNTDNRISSGPIIAMRVGDLFQYKAGFIRSLSYDWNFLGPGGKWELTKGMRMPQACTVTMSYQVIHESMPHRDYDFYGGPAGGLNAGMRKLQRIDYNAFSLINEDITGSPEGSKYIPSPNLSGAFGERRIRRLCKKWQMSLRLI